MLLNLNTDKIETMTTKDFIHVANCLTDKFKQAYRVYVPAYLTRVDRVNNQNTIIEFVVQMIRNNEEKDNAYYICSYSRGTEFKCINGITVKEVKVEEWREELNFINRFNK